ncbi:MAG: endonuclease/exonuclease/phosphatase family protein [Spirochaetes bacterium]|nr:endonuclease/exonuclease/phosphatase family protein [Spirochaetota bacterium]
MSCNIRYSGADDKENRWTNRKEICADIIRRQTPDIICFQEMWERQFIDLTGELPGYATYGIIEMSYGRNPTNCIFYRSDRFGVTSAAGYWLSETPHVPGSRSWGSDNVRLANWIRLRDRISGIEFRVVNTHIDHISQTARENQARLLCEDAAGYPDEFPQMLTGDMNSDALNPAIGLLLKNGWSDTYEQVHGTATPGFTYHGFKGPAYELGDTTGKDYVDKMDWIFVRGAVNVQSAAIIKDAEGGRYPSDHYFISADVEL